MGGGWVGGCSYGERLDINDVCQDYDLAYPR